LPRGLRWRHSSFHQHKRGAQLFLIECGTAGSAASGACGVHAVAGALSDEAALELCNRAEDMKHQLTSGRRSVDFLFEREKRDPAFLEGFDDFEQLAERAPQSVEANDGDRVARADMVEKVGEAGRSKVLPEITSANTR
jgi:glycine/D-amino acid oxidase-like deaminating enzyme